MNGPQKFVLLVAYLARGKPRERVSLAEIERTWNGMTGNDHFGMKFNVIYALPARKNGWVSRENARTYKLRPEWREIFS
jgi:hypothetical protein